MVVKYLNNYQKQSNFTQSEATGPVSLGKKVEAHEIVIYPTEKNGKLAVTTMECYLIQRAKQVAQTRKSPVKRS